jgi:hypothetical protein
MKIENTKGLQRYRIPIRRIAVLRTDIPEKQYLFRVIPEEKPDSELESAAIAVQAAATETNTHQRKLERVQ